MQDQPPLPRNDTERICLLGMHRSGTSCLAGALAAAGLRLGNTAAQGTPANPRGNFECRAIIVFHETVLRANGGSWNHPPATIHWQPRHRERALTLALALAEASGEPCGFKDPRTLLHLEHWQALPLTLHLAGIFRHPLACARSLQARDGMALPDALQLWMHYNQRLLTAWQRHAFPLVDFDLPAAALQTAFDATAAALGLCRPADTPFFDGQLRHHRSDAKEDRGLPEPVMALYRALQRASATSLPEVSRTA